MLRMALGTALSLCVSNMAGWDMAYIAPVVTSVVLALPKPSPGIGGCIKLFLALVVATYSGFVLLPPLLHQPLAGLMLLALAFFYAFHAAARGAPAAIATLITLGLTLVIAVGSVSVDALVMAAENVALNAATGVAFVWIAFAILPDPTTGDEAHAAPDPALPVHPVRSALRSLAVILPVAVWMLMSSASAANVGFMMKVATMGQQASVGDARAAARSLIISTLVGGAAAIVGWQLLQIWPSLILFTLIIAMAGLLFGRRIFSGTGLRDDAATWSYAFLTMLLILGPAVLDGIGGSPAGAKFFDRLWMFTGATVYGVGAVFVFDLLSRPQGLKARSK